LDELKKRTSPQQHSGDLEPPAADRRRVARIVHDERGTARVEWQDVASDRAGAFERVPLAIDGEAEPAKLRTDPSYRASKGFNPYDRVGKAGTQSEPEKPKRRDLRALSEWIKLKRELEERKARGEE
jgi:hypothetical protein